MKVRFLKPFLQYRKDSVGEFNSTITDFLIRNRYVVPNAPGVETATAEPVAERAVQRKPRKRKAAQ